MMGRKVFVATPVQKELVGRYYCHALTRSFVDLTKAGVAAELHTASGYDVATQRDVLATQFLESDATHIWMVDDDISFLADLPMKLLSFEKDFIGAVCPHRWFDTNKLTLRAAEGKTGDELLSLSHRFALRTERAIVANELLKVDFIGAGCIVLSRACVERMAEGATKYRPQPKKAFALSLFRRDLDESGDELTEDWSFCKRWRECGGEIFAYPFAAMSHTGPYQHVARFSDQFPYLGRVESP